jgi:hypothetical protein
VDVVADRPNGAFGPSPVLPHARSTACSGWSRGWSLSKNQALQEVDREQALDKRSPAEVFYDHLALRSRRDLETDLARNYSPDVLVLTGAGAFRGHEGIRTTASILREHCGDAAYEYLREVVEGDFAYLVWQVRPSGRWVHGADSFRIDDGKIALQTIHYLVVDDVVVE